MKGGRPGLFRSRCSNMEKKGNILGHKWAAGPLALLFFLLWHSLDLKASVTETGNTWLFGWYAGLGALVLAAAVFLGDELFIRRKMTLEALFAVSVLCLGGIYSLVLPPLSAPDEVSHYISAYECSNRLMGLPSVNEKGLIQIRPEDAWLEDVADVLADDGSAEGGDEKPVILGQSLTEETYRRIHEERSGENEAVHRENVQSSSSQGAGQMASSYQFSVRTTPLAYWPQALGFVLARLLGLGSLMAFPGSMFGALICGLVYQKTQNIPATLIGEVFGTSVLGGLTAYPVAIFLMGKSAAGLAFYAYVIPFLISTAGGAVISGVLIYSLKKANILAGMQEAMGQ